MSLHLTIQFSQCSLLKPDNVIGKVNHTMFYVHIQNRNRKRVVYHRVHCKNGPNDVYYVESSVEKFAAPRKPVGEEFKVPLTAKAKKLSAIELATILAKLPPPELNKGACQWWVLRNLTDLVDSGYVKKDTVQKLLADPRMDSTRLMEFEPLRDELQGRSSLSPKSLITNEENERVKRGIIVKLSFKPELQAV